MPEYARDMGIVPANTDAGEDRVLCLAYRSANELEPALPKQAQQCA